MKLKFHKYQGAGNDFILIDNRKGEYNDITTDVLEKICDRKFGIGSDGVMFLQERDGYDFEMIYHNSDGKISSMCGNGGRCIVAFAKYLNIIDTKAYFLAIDGPHYARTSEKEDLVSIQMIDVHTIVSDEDGFILNTGSPHYVICKIKLDEVDIHTEGRAIRNSEAFVQEGINVNFVEDFGDHCYVRTYERGVEGETLACGTGATAVALALAKHKGLTGKIITPIKVRGGHLTISFDYDGLVFSNIYLEGPARRVFEGEIELNNYISN